MLSAFQFTYQKLVAARRGIKLLLGLFATTDLYEIYDNVENILTIQCVKLLEFKVEHSPSIDCKAMTDGVLRIIVFCLSTKSIRNTKLMPGTHKFIYLSVKCS